MTKPSIGAMEIDTAALRAQRRVFIPALRQGIHGALGEVGEDVRASITSGAYFKNRSGKTSKKFRVIFRSSTEAAVVAPGKVPVILNAGSKAHVIAAKKKKFLRFTAGAGAFFRKRVNHPGTKPADFVGKETKRIEQLLPAKGQAATDQAISEPALAETPRDLVLGGLRAPPPAQAVGANLLAVFDPWLAAAIPYFKYAINSRLSLAFEAAMAGQAPGPSGQCAVIEVANIDPAPFLGAAAMHFPLLAIYPRSGEEAAINIQRERVDTIYEVVYVLPEMDYPQALRVSPMLQAVLAVLLLALEEGCLPDYESGAMVWEGAGTTEVRMVSHVFGTFEMENHPNAFPCLTTQIRVRNQERYDATKAPDLTLIYEQTAIADSEAGNMPVSELNTEFPMKWTFQAVAHVDVPCPRATEVGVLRVIGKSHDDETGLFVVGEPSSYDLDVRGAAQLRGFFAKALRLGQLLPADEATAKAFGRPFAPPPPAAPPPEAPDPTPAAAPAAEETAS